MSEDSFRDSKIDGMVLTRLETIAIKLDTLATRDELRELKNTVGSMVPRTEMDARWRFNEATMEEIRKAIEALRLDLNGYKARLDRLDERRIPAWLTTTIASVISSLAVIFAVWAFSQAGHGANQTNIRVSP